MGAKVAVLMSGGVDSSVAALLLKEAGYEVLGLTMLNWSARVPLQAKRVAGFLGIDHQVVDLRPEFKQKVVDYFCMAYQQGFTPNPCVVCNETIKFGVLIELADGLGCRWVSTGHYARVEQAREGGRYRLRKGRDTRKDQSYFLYRLKQDQLTRLLLPLGEMTKADTLALAAEAGLPVPAGESQEICFIEEDYRSFLVQNGIKPRPGLIVDNQGNVLGRHRGLSFYTVGQRRGLGLSVGKPLYVVALNVSTNTLVVGEEEELYRHELCARDNNFIPFDRLEGRLEVEAKIRYAALPAQALIFPQEEEVGVRFTRPQRAITPGQSVVYYQGDLLLGGGIIKA